MWYPPAEAAVAPAPMRPSVLTSPTPRMTRRRRTAVLLCSANHDVDSTGRNGTASAVAMSRIARRKRRLKLRVTRRTFRPCEADSSGAHSRVERPSVREPRESSGLRRSTGAPPYQRLPALPRSYRPAVLRDVEDAAIVTNAAADGFGLEVRVIGDAWMTPSSFPRSGASNQPRAVQCRVVRSVGGDTPRFGLLVIMRFFDRLPV